MAESSLAKIQSLGGVLKTSTEELSSLAKQAGLPSAPTTAATAAMIGANPDQAKMSGSGQQMTAAIQMALRPEATQAYQERVESGRTKAKAGDQVEALPEYLKQLTGLGGKVEAAAKAKIEEAAQAQFAASLKDSINLKEVDNIALTSAGTVDEAKKSQILGAVKKWKDLQDAGAKDPEKMAALNELFGIVKDKAQIAKLFGTDETKWTEALAKAIPPTISMNDLMKNGGAELGIQPDQLASYLGVDAKDIGNMSWSELKAKTNQKLTDRYANTDLLLKQSNDTTLPPAVRNAAQKRLRELGAAGAITAGEESRTLEQQIEAGDDIEFAGQKMDVETFLQDDRIQNTLKGLLDGTISPEKLKGTPYEKLLDFAKQHKDELSKKYNVPISEQFQNIEKNTQAITSELSKIGLSPSTLTEDQKKLFGITPGMLSGSEAFVANPYMSRLAAAPEDARNALMALKGNGLKEFMDANLPLDTATIQSYQQASEFFNGFYRDFNGDGKTDASDISQALSQKFGIPADQLATFDFDTYDIDLPTWADANNDGVVDNPENIAKVLGGMDIKAKKAFTDGFNVEEFGMLQNRIGELTAAKTVTDEESSAVQAISNFKFPDTNTAAGITSALSYDIDGNVNSIAASVAGLRKIIENLTPKLNSASTIAARAAIQSRIDALQRQIDDGNAKAAYLVSIKQELAKVKKPTYKDYWGKWGKDWDKKVQKDGEQLAYKALIPNFDSMSKKQKDKAIAKLKDKDEIKLNKEIEKQIYATRRQWATEAAARAYDGARANVWRGMKAADRAGKIKTTSSIDKLMARWREGRTNEPVS